MSWAPRRSPSRPSPHSRLPRELRYMSSEQATPVTTTALVAQPASSGAVREGDAVPERVATPESADVREEHKSIPTCANCGAQVPEEYCGRCGQRLEHAMH